MPTRTANATWKGGLKGGQGEMALGSGAYTGSYSFGSRFEQAKGTNPEELIGAAHAGWRGLADGVLEATVAAMGGPPGDILAWLGPTRRPWSSQNRTGRQSAVITTQARPQSRLQLASAEGTVPADPASTTWLA